MPDLVRSRLPYALGVVPQRLGEDEDRRHLWRQASARCAAPLFISLRIAYAPGLGCVLHRVRTSFWLPATPLPVVWLPNEPTVAMPPVLSSFPVCARSEG